MTSNAKWTSPRAAQWVPTASTLSSPGSSPASSSSFDTTPRKRPRYNHQQVQQQQQQSSQHHHHVMAESRMVASVDSRSMQSVDVFDQLQAQSERKKPHLSTKDEIRALRAEVIELEKTFRGLTAKWRATVPSYSVLHSACAAARERCATSKSQKLNGKIKSELLLQQLYFAALQSGFAESPLLEYPNSRNIFDAIHTDVRLPVGDEASRITILNAALETNARIAPGLVHSLTRNHADRASLSVPYMNSSITADDSFTYVSTMFIAKIQHATVEQVFCGVLSFFQHLKTQVKYHFGIQYDTQSIHNLSPSSEYGLVRYVKEDQFATSWNSTLTSKLTTESGAIVCDFVESDEMYPVGRRSDCFRKEVAAMFTVASIIDEATGVPCIVLRQVRVARYSLLPNSKLLHEEIELDKGFSNGDLLMAIVCRHLCEVPAPATTAS